MVSFRSSIRITQDRTSLFVWGVASASWAILFAWSDSAYVVYLGHSELGAVSTVLGFISLSSVFLIGWTLMITAMMLPTLLPFVNEFRRVVFQTHAKAMVALPLLLGYVGWWLPFGIAVYVMDFGIHRIADTPLFLGNSWMLGTSALSLAGTYQFTRTKQKFVRDCCYPGDFIRTNWKNKAPEQNKTFRLGLKFGKADMGSHWALMLLMFALELGSVPGMLVMGLAMAAEKTPRLSGTARMAIGIALVGAALYIGLARLQ
jgi:predicted metal-binding membrane protein